MDSNNPNSDKRALRRKPVNHRDKATNEKKPFDKKKYRLQKYSNKYKVDQWNDRRKKAALRTFYKDLQKDQVNTKPSLAKAADGKVDDNGDSKKSKSPFFAAKQEFKRRKAEKQVKKEQLLKSKEEREQALSKYKEKKMQTYKKLSKKTKKGQPVMKDRLEMLLEKIKESTSS